MSGGGNILEKILPFAAPFLSPQTTAKTLGLGPEEAKKPLTPEEAERRDKRRDERAVQRELRETRRSLLGA